MRLFWPKNCTIAVLCCRCQCWTVSGDLMLAACPQSWLMWLRSLMRRTRQVLTILSHLNTGSTLPWAGRETSRHSSSSLWRHQTMTSVSVSDILHIKLQYALCRNILVKLIQIGKYHNIQIQVDCVREIFDFVDQFPFSAGSALSIIVKIHARALGLLH